MPLAHCLQPLLFSSFKILLATRCYHLTILMTHVVDGGLASLGNRPKFDFREFSGVVFFSVGECPKQKLLDAISGWILACVRFCPHLV